MINSLIKGVGNVFGPGLETYGKNWKEKPAGTLTGHTTAAIAGLAVHEQKKSYRLKKYELELKQNLAKVEISKTADSITHNLKQKAINKKQAISQLNHLGIDGNRYLSSGEYVELQGSLQSNFERPQTKFGTLSQQFLVNQNKIVSISTSTSEVSGNCNELSTSRNLIAQIAVDSSRPTSLYQRSSVFRSDIVWVMIGLVVFAGSQILCYTLIAFLQKKKILKKQFTLSEQFEIIIENQNQSLEILKRQEKQLEQQEKRLEQLEKKCL